MSKVEAQVEILNILIKDIIKRIKQIQEEKKYQYTQEDVWIKNGIENEFIGYKIYLEKLKKKLKYTANETN